MELRSYKSYIDMLISENFDFETFSPENSSKLIEVFKKYFYCDTPYWKQEAMDRDMFCIEFKKYGENRKRIFLQFSFVSNSKNPRILALTLTNDDIKMLDGMSVELSLSDIWKDHTILVTNLKKIIEKGLDLAAATY